MDYISLIANNSKPEELLHEVTVNLAKEYTTLAKLLSDGNIYGAAELVGSMSFDIDLLKKVDGKISGAKKTTVIA